MFTREKAFLTRKKNLLLNTRKYKKSKLSLSYMVRRIFWSLWHLQAYRNALLISRCKRYSPPPDKGLKSHPGAVEHPFNGCTRRGGDSRAWSMYQVAFLRAGRFSCTCCSSVCRAAISPCRRFQMSCRRRSCSSDRFWQPSAVICAASALVATCSIRCSIFSRCSFSIAMSCAWSRASCSTNDKDLAYLLLYKRRQRLSERFLLLCEAEAYLVHLIAILQALFGELAL